MFHQQLFILGGSGACCDPKEISLRFTNRVKHSEISLMKHHFRLATRVDNHRRQNEAYELT